MRILSLFDGMSCGQIALNRLGLKDYTYYASEVDKYAIQITQKNFPNTIQVGDVTELKSSNFKNMDLLMAGSPCQGFSFAGKQLNFNDPRSALFFEFLRLMKEIKPRYFLLENVRMKKEWLTVISESCGVEPYLFNSAKVSAQNRLRYYWTNIEVNKYIDDKGILLKDILEKNYQDKYKVSESHKNRVLFAKRGKGYFYTEESDKICTLPASYAKHPTDAGYILESPIREKSKTVRSGGRGSYDRHEWDSVDELHWRKLTPKECERLQTVPDNYTEGVSNFQRYKMLGNGWTVDIVKHILKPLFK
tara:strand:- start:45 stop:959 length:915 start_codon:yes stop_codon:yes gene_type:complete